MSRALRITLLLLLLAVLAGLLEFPALRLELLRFERQELNEEEARREVIRPVAEGRPENKEKVFIFWLSAENPQELVPVEATLALGSDPALRARIVLERLISGAPTPEQRALPPGAALQAFYLLPDGTAVADFSDALSHEMPSGILTEQLAVEAITRTLHAAVPQARRLKVLIAGQEVETLAGHVDLTSTFDLSAMSPATPGSAPAGQAPEPTKPAAPPPRAKRR